MSSLRIEFRLQPIHLLHVLLRRGVVGLDQLQIRVLLNRAFSWLPDKVEYFGLNARPKSFDCCTPVDLALFQLRIHLELRLAKSALCILQFLNGCCPETQGHGLAYLVALRELVSHVFQLNRCLMMHCCALTNLLSQTLDDLALSFVCIDESLRLILRCLELVSRMIQLETAFRQTALGRVQLLRETSAVIFEVLDLLAEHVGAGCFIARLSQTAVEPKAIDQMCAKSKEWCTVATSVR